MNAISGVSVEKDAEGNLTHVSIDLREHQDAIPKLKEIGLLPKSQFDIDFENGHTVEQFMEAMETVITKHYGNSH